MKSREILANAIEAVQDREKAYGSPTSCLEKAAEFWSVILGIEVSADDVALCLIGLKMARLNETRDHTDSWVDIAGYSACGGEVTEKENK